MSDDSQRPIIIKKKKAGAHGHHGGAWKIAYADFVTAMMAFFLLMWLLGSTTKARLQGIAEFFKNPVRVSTNGGQGSGDSSSLLKGGGQDLTRSTGQRQKSDQNRQKTINLTQSKKDKERLIELKQNIEKAIKSNPRLNQFKEQILLDLTKDGLRIQIIDQQDRPMFDSGSAILKPYMREILQELGHSLNAVPNPISISGHTDSMPYVGGAIGYSNWELSADRANASRRELIFGGMSDEKVLRVTGLASAVPLKREDPLHPSNRRITLVVLNDKAQRAILSEGKDTLEVDSQGGAPNPQDLVPTPFGNK